jgi:hypothetical protein
VTGPRIFEKFKLPGSPGQKREKDEKVPRLARVFLMRTSENNIAILQGARIIGRLVWEKKKPLDDGGDGEG